MNTVNKQDIPSTTAKNKVALVTGSARRIGAAIIKQLHAANFLVAIHCHHSLEDAQELAKTLNQQRPKSAAIFQKDLTTTKAAKKLINEVISWSGHLDLLVNNASIFMKTSQVAFDAKSWMNLFTINTKIPFELSIAAFPFLSTRLGAIINLTDIHTVQPLKDYSVYCQSKAALVMQTKSLAREFAPSVRVNAVAPGSIIWPEGKNTLTFEMQQKIINKTLLKQQGKLESIAQSVQFLAENTFITGQILQVDGGRSIY